MRSRPIPKIRLSEKDEKPRTLFLEKGLHFCKVYDIIARYEIEYLPVAQLDSASDSDSEGQRFESARVGQNKRHRIAVPFVLAYLLR